MKHCILLCLFFSFFVAIAMAQDARSSPVFNTHTNSIDHIDRRLYAVFEKEYLENLRLHNPFLLLRWTFDLDNAYYVMEYPDSKGWDNMPTVIIRDLNNINIFLLQREQGVQRDLNKQNIYRIANAHKVLILYSEKECMQMLNQRLGRTQKN